MSCLLNKEAQTALRGMVANDLYTRAKNETPVVLEDYVKEVYDFVKTQSDNEALAVDAARLVPTMVKQIGVLKPEFYTALEKNTPDIELDAVKLSKTFDKSVDAVREV